MSLTALVLANLIPLIGAWAFGWNVFSILLLYWIENVLTGVLNLFRMAIAGAPMSPPPNELFKEVKAQFGQAFTPGLELTVKAFAIPFFLMHYGIFTLVHGVFVFAFFFDKDFPLAGVAIAAVALFVSHLFSFFHNYIGKGEYREATVMGQMVQPYKRVVVLHLTVLGGGFAVLGLGQPVWALLVMVTTKTVFDMGLHLWEHKNPSTPPAPMEGALLD
jgi:hypothetical protein